MNTKARWTIALLMVAKVFRAQTLTLLPDLEMFDGPIPVARQIGRPPRPEVVTWHHHVVGGGASFGWWSRGS